jgi:hypothetical protein
MEKFLEVLNHRLERPGMYGVNRVEDLYHFIWGYATGANSQEVWDLMSDFRVSLNKDWKTTKENHDWPRLIKLYSGSDLHSVELFKQKLNEFLNNRKNKKRKSLKS